jgi:hypothetical protein
MSELKIKSGTKLQLALDAPTGKEPEFNMVCTFGKALDESAFLISIPMHGGKRLELDENQKLLIRYNQGSDPMILAGYADDVVKDGVRSFWKIRRVSEQRQFFQRADERIKVALKVDYRQDTWALNDQGAIDPESGMTLDISAGGAALYLNRRFEVGEIITLTLPRIGTTPEGKAISDIVAVVCWEREAPKGSLYRHICGVQFRLEDGPERKRLKAYVEHVKKKYKL